VARRALDGGALEEPAEQRKERNLRARARSAAAKIGLALVAVLATLIGIELVLSALFEPVLKVWQVREIFQLDDELIYSLKPNQERIAKSEEFVEHVTTNSNGLRDDEIRPRDSFEKRIIVLGDSMIFGHGVNDDQTFPNQLEAIYRDEHRAVDVINAGVKGYGTDSAHKFFAVRLQPLSLQPDLVIFAVYDNDLYDNIGLPLYTIENGSLAPLDPTRNWLYLLGTIEQKTPEFIRNRILYGIVLSRFVGRDIYSVLPDESPQELTEWAARKAFLEIVDLRRRGRRQGFRLMVLCVPDRDGPPNAYAWLEPLEKIGIWLVDPSKDPVWSAEKQRWFFRKDYHMTPAGNRLLAEMVHEAIARRGL
jgi:lysophospholipase L1-like esterase